MKHSKQHYRDIKVNSFTWGGFDDGVHYFSKERRGPDHFSRYETVYCTEECLENGNYEWMAIHGYTLDEAKVKAIQKKYRKVAA